MFLFSVRGSSRSYLIMPASKAKENGPTMPRQAISVEGVAYVRLYLRVCVCLSLSLSFSLSLYSICVCVCVCVCAKIERNMKGTIWRSHKKKGKTWGSYKSYRVVSLPLRFFKI